MEATLTKLMREQKINKIKQEVLEACSTWGSVDKPTMPLLEAIINKHSEKIMQIAESEE